MGKFCFPSSCFSCSCFSSSSSQQQPANAGTSHSTTTSTSTSTTTPAENVGPSTSPNAGTSTPREGTLQQPENAAPSQLPQQPNAGPSHSTTTPPLQNAGHSHSTTTPSNAGPSTTTSFDLKSFLHQFNDINQLHHLIKLIEDLLKNASGEKGEEGSTSQVTYYIEGGQTFMEFADKHFGKLPGEVISKDGLSADTSKILIDLLKGLGEIHWVGAALSVVGFVLAKFNQKNDNKTGCLETMKRMVNLGKQIVELYEQMPEKEQRLKEAVACIVEGCILCTSQLSQTKIFRFLASSVNAATLNAFNVKIDRLYGHLHLSVSIDTHKRVREIQETDPKNAPQSQELYARPGAVGIESAQDEVIKLLDLSAQHLTSARVVVVVHGFGGIGKTTLADAVYARIDLQNYNHCRIHMEQNCTNNDIKVLQEQILKQLFRENVTLNDCDHGRGLIRSLSRQNNKQPLFLYIDNGLKSTDLQQLLLEDLGDWLPVKSRLLITTRNLHETDLFVSWNVQRHDYSVSPLPNTEGRKILLKKVRDYNDESNIVRLLELCGGVPLLLELAGSQLAINGKSRNKIVLEMLSQGEKVGEKDISDRMVDFVYRRLSLPVKEAFLFITTYLYTEDDDGFLMLVVGEEAFRALEDASFIKRGGEYNTLIIHDIVKARGKRMSEEEGNIIITDGERLSKCLVDEEKLKKVQAICILDETSTEQPPIEINESHLNCMSDSLIILRYKGDSPIKLKGRCRKPFKKLRYLQLPGDEVSELPMEFEKLDNLAQYCGPLTEDMSLYELPPSLRWMTITNIISSENGVAHSRIPRKDNQPSSLGQLAFWEIEGMERLPNGVEKLTKLEGLCIWNCPKLKELPSKIGDLSNLKEIYLYNCSRLEEWPSSLGELSKLKRLDLEGCCSSKLKESLPSHLKEIADFDSTHFLNLIF